MTVSCPVTRYFQISSTRFEMVEKTPKGVKYKKLSVAADHPDVRWQSREGNALLIVAVIIPIRNLFVLLASNASHARRRKQKTTRTTFN